jgi:hypothetical protein
VQSNPLSSECGDLPNLPALTRFVASKCQLRGCLPRFPDSKRMALLSLNDNALVGTIGDVFDHMTQLQRLDLT